MQLEDNKVGVVSFGIKTGIITENDNMVDVIKSYFLENKDMIQNKDIICITEAVVGITEHNFVTLNEITSEIKNKLKLSDDATLGVMFPILSRNRFTMILKAITRVVPKGKIIIQLLFPSDEQGNRIIENNFYKNVLNKGYDDKITLEDIGNNRFHHPETGVDYLETYMNIVKEEGANVDIYLANSEKYMIENNPDAIIVSNVHHRKDTLDNIKKLGYENVITLQDIFSDPSKKSYSKYGLLGSNILDPKKETLKLAPREPDVLCLNVQKMIKQEFDKDVEVIVYGDGAYKDPETGIYELADPVSAFGVTPNIRNRNRTGVKTKYLMQKLFNQGRNKSEILEAIEKEKQRVAEEHRKDDFSSEGTTPRKIENLVASLADLVSGSADANTPVVVVRGFI